MAQATDHEQREAGRGEVEMSKTLRRKKIAEILEAGYWKYDAMISGHGAWKGIRKTQRDAFKLAASWVYVEILRIE